VSCVRGVQARLLPSEALNLGAFLFGSRTDERPRLLEKTLGFLAGVRTLSAWLPRSPAQVYRVGFPRVSQAEALLIVETTDPPSQCGRIASVPTLDP
jgi:hypothetical protein